MHVRNCNSSRACEVYVRMRLATRVPKQAARRWQSQSGELPHANNEGPGLDGPGAPPAVGPMRSQIAGSGVHAAYSAGGNRDLITPGYAPAGTMITR